MAGSSQKKVKEGGLITTLPVLILGFRHNILVVSKKSALRADPPPDRFFTVSKFCYFQHHYEICAERDFFPFLIVQYSFLFVCDRFQVLKSLKMERIVAFFSKPQVYYGLDNFYASILRFARSLCNILTSTSIL